MAELTNKQRMFVEEYLVDLNATQAAIRAGYSAETANEQGARLLASVNIQTRIKTRLEEKRKCAEITAEKVLLELAKIAFSDLKGFVEFGPGGVLIKSSEEVDGTVLSEISETITQTGGSKKVKLHDKLKALELLCEHLGVTGKTAAMMINAGKDGNLTVEFKIPPTTRKNLEETEEIE